MLDLDEILKTLLDLDVDSRAQLANRLFESLEHLPEEDISDLWARVAQDRLQSFQSGESSSTPADQVFERAKKLLK